MNWLRWFPRSMPPRQVSLRWALLVPAFMTFTATAGLICLLNSRDAGRSAEELAIELQQVSIDEAKAILSNELRGPQQAIKAMADAVNSGLVDPHNEQQTAKFLRRLAGVFPNAPFLNYGLEDGYFIGVGQNGNKRNDQMVLVVTKPDAVLRTAQYALNADGSRGRLDYDSPIADFRTATWYAEPLRVGRPTWSQIYNWDDQPDVMALGAGVPIRKGGRLVGVAGADMILANIGSELRKLARSSGGILYIVDRNGLLVASSAPHRPFDLVNGKAQRRNLQQDPDPWIKAAGQATAKTVDAGRPSQASMQLKIQNGRQHGLLRLTPWHDARGLQWEIGMVLPESSYLDIVGEQTRSTIAIAALAIVIASAMGWWAIGFLCRPLAQLSKAAEELAAGDGTPNLPASSVVEIDRLTAAFNSMALQIYGSVANLKAHQEEIESEISRRSDQLRQANAQLHDELNRAARLQSAMLIQPHELAGMGEALDAAVRLLPSKEVAGDLYDAIKMGSHRVCFCIGDVSGKGLPAALLMSTCLSLLRTYVELLDSPAEIMQGINHHLCKANEDCAFTTLLIAIYHSHTGDLWYCNAGHNPALLCRSNKEIESLNQVHGPALGISEAAIYGQTIVNLAQGDLVLAYTDGAKETSNNQGQRYGIGRLSTVIRQHHVMSSNELVDFLLSELTSFSDGKPARDDTTLLTFRRLPGNADALEDNHTLSLQVGNQLSGVAEAIEQVKRYGKDHAIPTKQLRNLLVVIDELLNNIIAYGCKHLGNDAEIGLKLSQRDERLVLVIRDNGIAFNPIARQSPDIASGSEERRIGGLGIHLVRNLTIASRYKREDHLNWLTLELK